MRWKEVIIGAIVTLAVTIIGGLAVYYFTNESGSKIEKLTYQIDRQVSFSGENNKLAIGVVRIANVGELGASDVKASISMNNSSFLEYNIESENGVEIHHQLNQANDQIDIEISSLLSGESLTVTYLLPTSHEIQVSLRSDQSVGVEGITYLIPKDKKSELSGFLNVFLPLLAIISIIILFVAKRIVGRTNEVVRDSSANNVGFALFHNGLTKKARKVLTRTIEKGEESSSYAISNLAAVLAVSGDVEQACKYMQSAKMLCDSDCHSKAIMFFNEAIVSYQKGEYACVENDLVKALELSNDEIVYYIKSSVVMANMRGTIPTIDSIFTDSAT